MTNAGKYNKRITICKEQITEDAEGFRHTELLPFYRTFASVKTLRGMTLIRNNTDFEKAFVNFTIRMPKKPITRDMVILYNGKKFAIEYLNDVNAEGIELEIQAKEVTH